MNYKILKFVLELAQDQLIPGVVSSPEFKRALEDFANAFARHNRP